MVVLAAMVGATALSTLSQGLALGIVGLSLVLLVGFAGQVSLCQLTFMGIGAFTMGKTLGGDSWWGLLLAVVVSGAVGALVALPDPASARPVPRSGHALPSARSCTPPSSTTRASSPTGRPIDVGRLRLPFMSTVSNQAELIEVAVAAALCAFSSAWCAGARTGGGSWR